VIGGGVIGCEFAPIFVALGVMVTLVDDRDRLLPCAISRCRTVPMFTAEKVKKP